MNLLLQAFGVLVGTAASAVLFNVPRHVLLWSAVAGLTGWAIQTQARLLGLPPAAGALLGAVTVSLVGEGLARARRMPALVFVVPGILPLVPGTRAYHAMLALLKQNHALAAAEGAQALIAAGGIAVGLLMGTALTRTWGRAPQGRQAAHHGQGGAPQRQGAAPEERGPSPRPGGAVVLPLKKRRSRRS